MKKLSTLLLSMLLVFVYATGVFAQPNAEATKNVEAIVLNDKQIDVGDIVTIDEVTYVPVRTILEALNYNIKWDAASKVVLAEKYDYTVSFQVSNSNGDETELSTSPRIINNTTYISLESISEALNLKLDWNTELKTATLVSQESKGFIWKVEKDDVDVYLLGSIHVGQQSMYPLREDIEKAYLNSDKLVVEVNIGEQPSDEVLADIQALQTYTDGSKLQDHVSAETYERIVSFLADLNLPADTYDGFKPWAVYLDMNAFATATVGYDSALGIDLYYLQKAQLHRKPILELESFNSQFSMFNDYSDELQEQLINEALDEIYGEAKETETTEPSLDLLADLWVTGDDKSLEELVAAFKANEEMYEHLLLNRHPQMLQKIEGYLNNTNEETYFVIAGYLHMLGEDGLITLLKEKGYKVTRM